MRQVLTTIRSIKDPAIRAEALADMAGKYQVLKRSEREIEQLLIEALSIVTPLPASEEKDQALNQIAFRYAENRQYEQALKAIEQIKDPFQRGTTTRLALDTAIRAEVEAGNPEAAFKLIETAKSTIFELSQFEAIKIPPEQLAQLQQQDRRRQQVQLLIGLAERYREAEQPQLFQQTLDRLFRLASQFDDDQVFVAQLLISFLGQTEKATELLNRAERSILGDSRATDPDSLTHLAEAFMQANQVDRALQLLDKAFQASDDSSWQSATLSGFASQLYERGKTQEANELLTRSRNLAQQISDPQEKVSALLQVATTYQSAEQTKEAIAIARQVQQFPSSVWQEQAGELFALFKSAGNYEQAERMAASANDQDNWITLVQHYTSVGNFDRALKIARSIPSISQRVAAFTSIAASYTKIGQLEKGSAMLLQAFQLAQTIQPNMETDEQTSTLTEMFTSYLEFSKHPQSAEQVLALMKLLKNSVQRETVISEVLRSSETDSLNLSSWLEVINGFANAEKRDEGLTTIAYTYANRNQYTKAIKTIQQMKQPYNKTRTLLGLFNRYSYSEFTLSPAEQETLRTSIKQVV